MDNMKVNNKRLQKLILDTQKSVGQLSKLAYETGVQDGLIKANALNALNPLDNTSMRWIPCSEGLPPEDQDVFVYLFYNKCPYIAWVNDGHWRTEEFDVDKEYEPIAWMPLPEPARLENV